jgi:hypothetical protein
VNVRQNDYVLDAALEAGAIVAGPLVSAQPGTVTAAALANARAVGERVVSDLAVVAGQPPIRWQEGWAGPSKKI